jgi:hypothetical protein
VVKPLSLFRPGRRLPSAQILGSGSSGLGIGFLSFKAWVLPKDENAVFASILELVEGE